MRVIHHQLRRELKLWQYYSIISHQLISYILPLTDESNQPSAEKRTGAVTVWLSAISWSHTLCPSQVRVINRQLRWELKLWQYYSTVHNQPSADTIHSPTICWGLEGFPIPKFLNTEKRDKTLLWWFAGFAKLTSQLGKEHIDRTKGWLR